MIVTTAIVPGWGVSAGADTLAGACGAGVTAEPFARLRDAAPKLFEGFPPGEFRQKERLDLLEAFAVSA